MKKLFCIAALFMAVEISAEQVTLTLYANGCEAANVINCPQGYPIRVTADPDYGYHFDRWSDGNTTNPRTLQVTTNTTLTATFAKNAYTITTSVNYPERGSTTGDTTVLYQDNVTISAVANYGYHFTRWNDGNTDNPRTFTPTESGNYQAIFVPNQYLLTTSSDGHGYVYGGGTYNYLSNVNMSVNADFGYHFVQWNDGNTDNPRSLTITCDTAFVAIIAKTYSGDCGNNLYWTYSNHALTIIGSGSMYSYALTTVPWGLFLDSIKTISLPAGCTSLGNNCFKDITGLKEITIPASVTTIGANAFAGCRKLYDIYCYAAEPPVAQSSSFENYNVYLHIPCDNKRDYELDAVFGSFKYIECMGAEPVPTPITTATVEPTETTAAITWPTDSAAATYTITITKDGVVFCTLIFDADGRLTSIAFAPGRSANTESAVATATSAGFSFTVTGLQSGTHYDFEIDVQNDAEEIIKAYTGTFDTKGIATSVDEVNTISITNRKVIRNGILLIERNGVYYNAQGAVVE